MAKVSLTKVEKDLYTVLIKAIDEIGEQLVAPGDCVLIKPKLPQDKAWLLVGDCARVEEKGEGNQVGGCPPDREELFCSLVGAIAK